MKTRIWIIIASFTYSYRPIIHSFKIKTHPSNKKSSLITKNIITPRAWENIWAFKRYWVFVTPLFSEDLTQINEFYFLFRILSLINLSIFLYGRYKGLWSFGHSDPDPSSVSIALYFRNVIIKCKKVVDTIFY